MSERQDMGVPPSGSGHSGQAPEPASGLGHSASVPNALEGAARAIAANKRKLLDDDPAIDRCWRSYIGQARAALNGSGLLQVALPYIDSMAGALGMMDGFGEKRARQADVDARTIRIALGFDLPPLAVGDLLRAGLTDADFGEQSERTGA